MKALVFFIGGWAIIGLTTPALPMFELSAWWGELIVLQKAMLWVVLWSATGYNESWGPLAFKFSPMTAAHRYWIRTGTLRLPPWPDKVPLTKGDERKPVDVILYLGMLGSLLLGLLHTGAPTEAALNTAHSDLGLLLPAWPFISYIVFQMLMGLRDKVTFLASRPEQYSVVLLGFGALTSLSSGIVDMVIVAKIAMFAVWWGAFVSKIGLHFTPTVQAMLNNAPLNKFKSFREGLYRNPPEDMLPSKLAFVFAHILGTLVEFVLPLVILFSNNWTLTVLATVGFMVFHLFIYSMFALAMPQEWNLFYVFYTPFVFLGFFNGDGYAVWDVSSWWIVVGAVVLTFTGPILGNLFPDKISFLISMRQYAGNWASGLMAFRIEGEAETKLDSPDFVTSSTSHRHQLYTLFGPEVAEIFLQKTAAFRLTQSQGRGQMSIFMNHLDDIDNYHFREGEMMVTQLVGWQFGDGHLFNASTIAAVQKRCNFEPGEWITVWTESQPLHKKTLEYQVIDAALGVVERGYYTVADAVAEQPWLPNGPIDYTVTWKMDGYQHKVFPPVAEAVATGETEEQIR